MRRCLLVVFSIVTVLASGPGSARAELITLYGSERVGSSGGQFLRIPVGARAVALGNANTALASGATALFSNPGALSTVHHDHSLFVSHFSYAADIDIHHMGYVQRHASWQWGFGLGVLDSGEIPRTTETQPLGTGQTFNADQVVATVGLSRLLTDRITLGASVKFLQESLDDYENRAYLLDLGALYYLGYRTARIGFAVNNFGPDLRLNGNPPEDAGFEGSWQSFPAPTNASFGFAYDADVFSRNVLTLGLDFIHPSDEGEAIVFATEWTVADAISFRGAFRETQDDDTITGGLGLRWDLDDRPIRLDYGFADRGSFGLLHTITLEIER